MDLDFSGAVLVLGLWSKLLSPSVPLCVRVCHVVCWPAAWSSLNGQSNLYHGRPFSKRKCAAQLPGLADNTKDSEDNTSKKLLEPVKFRSQGSKLLETSCKRLENRFETLFQFVVGFCLDDPNLRGLGFPRSQARGANTCKQKFLSKKPQWNSSCHAIRSENFQNSGATDTSDKLDIPFFG